MKPRTTHANNYRTVVHYTTGPRWTSLVWTREPLHGADPLEWAREWVDMRVFQVEIGGYAMRDG
jgi:hypothetical protein